MTGFTLLWQKILRSSIWIQESKETRLVWITMLALKDKDGNVHSSVVGLADSAKVTMEECQAALVILLAPDEGDSSGVEEGRRIRPIQGGWQIVNNELYRFSTESKREFWRLQQAEYRSLKKHEQPEIPASPKKESPLALSRSIMEAWNAIPTLSNCLVMSDKRRRGLASRITDPFFAANWQAALVKVSQSKFCNGESDRGWKASFDWFIQPDSVAKIMEGKYENRTKHSTSSKPNPRNLGAIIGPTNYATAKTRFDREREAKAQGVAGQVAGPAPAQPPS